MTTKVLQALAIIVQEPFGPPPLIQIMVTVEAMTAMTTIAAMTAMIISNSPQAMIHSQFGQQLQVVSLALGVNHPPLPPLREIIRMPNPLALLKVIKTKA